MFNRALQVKMVKNDKKNVTEHTPDEDLIIKFAYASKMAKDLAGVVGKAIVGYVVVDTVRQVLIAKALKP